jgi:hypothetical protein
MFPIHVFYLELQLREVLGQHSHDPFHLVVGPGETPVIRVQDQYPFFFSGLAGGEKDWQREEKCAQHQD